MTRLLGLYLIIVLFILFSFEQNQRKLFDFKFRQNDYKCKPERAEVVTFNRSYFEYLNVTTFKFNRTCTALNISFKYVIDIGSQLDVVVQAYKFLSNEYRYFPIRFLINICDVFLLDVMGFTTTNRCGNFTKCFSFKNEAYHLCNFVPDMSKFPPLIPSGRYMFELQGLYRSQEMWVARAYCEIYRPVLIPDK